MSKKPKFSRSSYLICILLIVSFVIAGCNEATSSSQSSVTKLALTATTIPTATATIIPTATTIPTATPTVSTTLNTQVTETNTTSFKNVAVSWSGNPTTMYTLSWANVRTAPATNEPITKSDAPATAVTVYGTANGEKIGSSAIWYRLSDQNSAPQYLYSGMVTAKKPVAVPTAPVVTATAKPTTVPVAAPKKVIKIDLAAQHAYAYENGTLVHDNLITSGRPELTTPDGTFSIFFKERNATFYPNPIWKGTPLDFAPEHINYALEFYDTGIYIHDATWRAAGDFGPGTENPHTAPDGSQATGSHGCINTTLSDAAWYYNWAPLGTTVIVYN